MQIAKARDRHLEPLRRVSPRRRPIRTGLLAGPDAGELMAQRQVAVNAEPLLRLRSASIAQGAEIERAVKRAVDALQAKAERRSLARTSSSIETRGEDLLVEWIRRDANGRVVCHEFAHRAPDRIEYTHTEWRSGRVVRRNLVAVVGGLKLSREERWREEPVEALAPSPFTPRRNDGWVLEHAYVDEGDAFVHRLYSQQPEGRLSLTERFLIDVPSPTLALEGLEPFSANEPICALEVSERRKIEGRDEQLTHTFVWAQRGYRVTRVEKSGKPQWRSEKQVGARYRSSTFGDGVELTIIERTAQGRRVNEQVSRPGSEQEAELIFDEKGQLERCMWTEISPDGARLEQQYRRRVLVTERGLEVFEIEQAVRTESRRVGKTAGKVWRRSRQTHQLKTGAHHRLLSLSEQILDPQQNRVQAVMDGRQAWVVVNGRAQHLAGDEVPWFRSLPSRERAIAVHALRDLTQHVKWRAQLGEDGLALLPSEGNGSARLSRWEHHLEELSNSALVQLVFQNPRLKRRGAPSDSLESLSVLSEAGVALTQRLRAALFSI